jgi:hypothetical protein
MPKITTPQQRMDDAFDNFMALSRVLQDDMQNLIVTDDDSLYWRRNFVRACAALIEGYGHCFRDMCAVGTYVTTSTLPSKEAKVIADESSFSTSDRIKLSLRAAYRLFGLQPTPNFGERGWAHAASAFGKRDRLVHPQTPADLNISDREWSECREGMLWVIQHLFNFVAILHKKHGA